MLIGVKELVSKLTGGRLCEPWEDIYQLLATVPMFSDLDPDFARALARCVEASSYSAGSAILDSSGDSRELFLIRSGRVRVSIASPKGDRDVVELGPDRFFGDVNLLSDLRGHISAFAIVDCDLLLLTRDRFDRLVKRHPELRDKVWQNFKSGVLVDLLKHIPFLSALPHGDIARLAQKFEWRTMVGGALIFLQADYGDEFHIIHRGMARVIVTQADGSKIERHLYQGDFFGELALTGDSERRATVRAGTDLETFVLKRSTFLKLLDSHSELRQRITLEQERYVLPMSGQQSE